MVVFGATLLLLAGVAIMGFGIFRFTRRGVIQALYGFHKAAE